MKELVIKKASYTQDEILVEEDGLVFYNNETDKMINCPYKQRPCYFDCAACEINKSNNEVICLRGSFIFGKVVDDDVLRDEKSNG